MATTCLLCSKPIRTGAGIYVVEMAQMTKEGFARSMDDETFRPIHHKCYVDSIRAEVKVEIHDGRCDVVSVPVGVTLVVHDYDTQLEEEDGAEYEVATYEGPYKES